MTPTVIINEVTNRLTKTKSREKEKEVRKLTFNNKFRLRKIQLEN